MTFCPKVFIDTSVIFSALLSDKGASAEILQDAPILASAINSKVDYLVTLDRKDFIFNKKVSKKSRLAIVTPAQLLDVLRCK